MSASSLARGQAVALVAALLLLLATAVDWYSTAEGEENRRIERIQGDPTGGESGQISREVSESASITAEEHERNAWDPDGLIDVLVLIAVLTAVAAAVAAGLVRARGRRPRAPLTPSAIAALAATAAAVLLAYRMIQKPVAVPGAEIEIGAPLALVALCAIAVGSALAVRAESDEPASAAGDEPRGAPAT